MTINLGATPWRYLKDQDPATAMNPTYDDSPANTQQVWSSVGVPQSPSDNDTFLNLPSGGGQGQLTGNILWYRKHFTLDASYANRKIFVEFEGAHMGTQVYINGTFIPGNSLINPQATHVIGFTSFIVDLTPYVKTDGSDNVLAVKVARGDTFFNTPDFSGAFRFGQADSGLFRPVWMYIKDRVYIPQNTWATLNTWGTYVSTVSASTTSAVIRVQTNVRNEYASDQAVTLLTQIVDAQGNVVASAQDSKTVASAPLPTTPVKTDPTVAPPPPTFDQTLTVANPTLWYPNNSTWGKPYLYTVIHTVSLNGVVVDAAGHTHHHLGPELPHHQRPSAPPVGRLGPLRLSRARFGRARGTEVARRAVAGRGRRQSLSPRPLERRAGVHRRGRRPRGDGDPAQRRRRERVRQPVPHRHRQQPSQRLQRQRRRHGAEEGNAPGHDRPRSQQPVGARVGGRQRQHRHVVRAKPQGAVARVGSGEHARAERPHAQSGQRRHPGLQRRRLRHRRQEPVPELAGLGLGILGRRRAARALRLRTAVRDEPGQELVAGPAPERVRDGPLVPGRYPRRDHQPGRRPRQAALRPGHRHAAGAGRHRGHAALHDARQRGVDDRRQPLPAPAVLHLPGGVDALRDQARGQAGVPLEPHRQRHRQRVQQLPVRAAADQRTAARRRPDSERADHRSGQRHGPGHGLAAAPGALERELGGGHADRAMPGFEQPRGQRRRGQPRDRHAGHRRAGRPHHAVGGAGRGAPRRPGLPGHGQRQRRRVRRRHRRRRRGQPRAHGRQHPDVRRERPRDLPRWHRQLCHLRRGPDADRRRQRRARQLPAAGLPCARRRQPVGRGRARQGRGACAVHAGHRHRDGQRARPEERLDDVQRRRRQRPHRQRRAAQRAGAGQQPEHCDAAVQPGGHGRTVGAVQRAGLQQRCGDVPVDEGLDADSGGHRLHVHDAGHHARRQRRELFGRGHQRLRQRDVAQRDDTGRAAQRAQHRHRTAGADGGGRRHRAVQRHGQRLSAADLPVAEERRRHRRRQRGDLRYTGRADHGQRQQLRRRRHQRRRKRHVGRRQPDGDRGQRAGHRHAAGRRVGVGGPGGDAVGGGRRLRSAALPVAVERERQRRHRFGDLHHRGGADRRRRHLHGDGDQRIGLRDQQRRGGRRQRRQRPRYCPRRRRVGEQPERRQRPEVRVRRRPHHGQPVESVQGVDPQWIAADMGTVKTFDRVVLTWENAYASAYQIQTSPDNNAWTTIQTVAGKGGTETVNFPTTSSRYVRMLGTARATAYGYSLYEFQVFDVPQCGGGSERYTTLPAQPGTYNSTIPGLPSGPFVPTVVDNVTKLTWQQYVTTFPTQGAQFTQPIAAQYCTSVGMRLPTQSEALTIASNNYAACAFPNPWTTWTSTGVAGDPTRAYFVSSAGVSSSQIVDNSPGWAMCVAGTQQASPQSLKNLLMQPASVSTTKSKKQK